MSTSLILLEQKYIRAARFGEYLEHHPDADCPLSEELRRQTTLYRIALNNLIEKRQAENVPVLDVG